MDIKVCHWLMRLEMLDMALISASGRDGLHTDKNC